MFILKLKLIIFNLITFSLIYNCVPEAPHDNPLDPFNAGVDNFSSIKGSVFTLYSPHTQLPGVKVIVKEAGRIAFTNNTGNFHIENLTPGKYTIVVSKTHFQSDSITINLAAKENRELESFNLNAIPRLKEIKYFSEITYSFLSAPIVRVVVDISVIDFDGADDIDSLYAWIPDYSTKMVIDTNDVNGLYITKSDSLGFDVFSLAEKSLYIVIKDKHGYVAQAGPFFIHRFIIEGSQPVSPTGEEVALHPLVFTWEKVNPLYSFTYEINIVKQEGLEREEVFNRDGISSNETSFSFDRILERGVYFWQIGVRDNKNNLVRSNEAVFQIQ